MSSLLISAWEIPGLAWLKVLKPTVYFTPIMNGIPPVFVAPKAMFRIIVLNKNPAILQSKKYKLEWAMIKLKAIGRFKQKTQANCLRLSIF